MYFLFLRIYEYIRVEIVDKEEYLYEHSLLK